MDRLEERLRQGLADDVETRPAEAILADVHAGARRRRVRRTAVLAAACAAIIGVGATVTGQQLDNENAGPSTPSLPDDAMQGAVDVSVSYDQAEREWTVFKLTINVGCVGCSTVWRQDPDAEGGWVRLHDFVRSNPGPLDRLLGPIHRIEFAANGRDGYAWSTSGRSTWALHTTHDAGQTWAPVEAGPRLSRSGRNFVGLTSTDAWSLHYGGRPGMELWRTSLGSDKWTQIVSLDLARVLSMLTTDDRVVLERLGERLRPGQLVSSADGVSWTVLDPPCWRENEPYAARTAVFMLCPRKGGGATLYRTTDFATWQEFGVSDLESVTTVMPLSDFQVVLVGQGDAVLMSASGSTEPVDLGVAGGDWIPDRSWDSASGRTLVVTYDQQAVPASAARSILASVDGRTWSEVE